MHFFFLTTWCSGKSMDFDYRQNPESIISYYEVQDGDSPHQFSSVQFSHSVMSDSLRPMKCSTPGLPVHHHLPDLLKLTSIELVMPSSHLILCRPFFLLLPIPPSIRVLSNESTLRMRWPKYWSFSFSIIPSKEQPGLISFRMDWLVLLAVYGTLKSLLQHHSSKASILSTQLFSQSSFHIHT